VTGIVEVKTGVPEQSVVVKTSKMMLPVGLKPPDSVAVSDAELGDPPMVSVAGETDVVTVGWAFITINTSPGSPHPVETAPLFVSPL
jgi:hypothetical protein